MATDPFRGELTVAYEQRERLEWAADERLARAVSSQRRAPTLAQHVVAFFVRHFYLKCQAARGEVTYRHRSAQTPTER